MSQPEYKGFKTINQIVKSGFCSQKFLRDAVKQHKVPGIYSGSRFYVNFELFKKQLDEMSVEYMNNAPKNS